MEENLTAGKSKTENRSKRVEYDLDNGLHIILEEDHFAPVVAYQIWVNVGSADESAEEAGLAHVLEHMLFKGTERRGVGEIARDVEGAGGDINAWTSFDETVYHIVMPSAEFERGLDILADAVQRPALDPEELAREIEVIREEIKRGKDSPQRMQSEELFRICFRKHPYRNPVIGTDESLRSHTREKVFDFYSRRYAPSNMTLVIAGDFEAEAVRPVVGRMFSDSCSEKPLSHANPVEPTQKKPRASVLSEPVQQAHVAVAFPGVPVKSGRLPAIEVLAVIMGQGESSRLIQHLQRDRQLVNDIYAYPYPGRSAGLFVIDMNLPCGKVYDTLEALGEEIKAAVTGPMPEAELEKAKTIVESEAIYQVQTMQGKARRVGYFYTHTGDSAFLERYLESVRKLSPADITAEARRLFSHDRANIVVIWPKEEDGVPEREGLLKRLKWEASPDPGVIGIPDADKYGIVRHTLSNGIRLFIKENRSAPLVSFQAARLAGLRFEDENNNGINNLIARVITLGTDTRSAKEIAEEVDCIAGGLNGFSGRNSLGLKGAVISRHFGRGFELFSDCFSNPSFNGEELKREKLLVAEEIGARDESPARVAFDLFQKTLYESHPFRMEELGTLESLARLEGRDLQEYHKRFTDPGGVVLSVVGDVSAVEVAEKAEELFGALEASASVPPPPEPESPATETRRKRKELKKRQVHLVLGFLGLCFDDDDRYPLDVLNAILGGQGGRLFVELRDRQSLAYAIASQHLESLDPGYFGVYIATGPEKRDAAINGILGELERILTRDVDAEELGRAKRYLAGSHAIGLQTNSSWAG